MVADWREDVQREGLQDRASGSLDQDGAGHGAPQLLVLSFTPPLPAHHPDARQLEPVARVGKGIRRR